MCKLQFNSTLHRLPTTTHCPLPHSSRRSHCFDINLPGPKVGIRGCAHRDPVVAGAQEISRRPQFLRYGGGRQEECAPFFKDRAFLYEQFCREVLQRDGWRCQVCGTMSSLEVHHQQERSHSGDMPCFIVYPECTTAEAMQPSATAKKSCRRT